MYKSLTGCEKPSGNIMRSYQWHNKNEGQTITHTLKDR